MKYKVGDKVKIRADLRWGFNWNNTGINITGDMARKAGKTATIKKVCVCDQYTIEEDMGSRTWHEEMFDGVVENPKTMKYKAGDKVRVRKDLEQSKSYGGVMVIDEMEELRGKFVTIEECFDWCNVYRIKDDGGDYNWTDEMFEGIAEEPLREVPTKDTTINDAVSHPSHYTDGKIEVIEFIQDKKLDFARGNVIKYIARAGKKDKSKELEDLKKARQYCDFAIRELEQKDDSNH